MKDTILSVIRHSLTAGFSSWAALSFASEEIKLAIVTAVVAMASAAWGATDEFLAAKKKK